MKGILAAEELPSDKDEDEVPGQSEDLDQSANASQSWPSTPLPSHSLELPTSKTSQHTSKKQNKIHSTDEIELEKIKFLQQMSTTFQNRRSQAADADTTFGVQVTSELKVITDPVLKNRVKRQIMTALYEAQESTYHPQPSSLNTYSYPQVQPHHVPPPSQTYTHTQAPPHQYNPHLSQTSFQRMLEWWQRVRGAVGATLFIYCFILYILFILDNILFTFLNISWENVNM